MITWLIKLICTCFILELTQAVSLQAVLHNHSHIANTSVKTTPDLLGDASCMRWTGGICHLTGCFSSRGHTECIDGRCLCQHGTCAMEDGTCKPARGKWLGSYAIKFANPAKSSASYVGVSASTPYELPGTDQYPHHENVYLLKATSDSAPLWRIAVTPQGHVRFQSEQLPDHMLMFYYNDVDPNDDEEELDTVKWKHQIPHNYNIWPVVIAFEEAVPLAITFQVRPTRQNGGGLEIWNPQTGYVLASFDAKQESHSYVSTDRTERRGIAECLDTNFRGTCKGRQLVQFSPPLPSEATQSSPRKRFYHGEVYYLWQKVLVTAVFFGTFIFVAALLYRWMNSS